MITKTTHNDGNSGDGNSGYWNIGNGNSGNGNSGDGNSGGGNSGEQNSGYWNTGNGNSGNGNSGKRNSGHWNSGKRNSGYWNSGNRNSGCLNTTEPVLRLFNCECVGISLHNIDFPDFFYFDLYEWIYSDNMSDKEKANNSDYKMMNGYLKVFDYTEAWQNSYKNADAKDKAKLLALPNFDADIFYEISGIRVNTKGS